MSRHSFSLAQPLAIPALVLGVVRPRLTAPLVEPVMGPLVRPPCRARAELAAVAVAAIASAAEREDRLAQRALPNSQLHAGAPRRPDLDRAGGPCDSPSRVARPPLSVEPSDGPGLHPRAIAFAGWRLATPLRADALGGKKPDRRFPRYPALAMIAIPRFAVIASRRRSRCGPGKTSGCARQR